MTKGYNPADAHRKALKAKEKKKNKQERVKARELGDVKKSTGGKLNGLSRYVCCFRRLTVSRL